MNKHELPDFRLLKNDSNMNVEANRKKIKRTQRKKNNT